jgi:hypothetical protein
MRGFGVRRAARPTWRKASFCQSGECVEVAEQNGMIILRDSKAPRRVLRYSTEEWQSFVLGIKAREFDDLGG